jgi:protein-arginine kinase activator protein McsA
MAACQRCGAEPASVDLTTIGDSAVTHARLCAACAESQGVALTLEGTTPLSSFMPELAGRRDLPDRDPPGAS